MSWKLPLCGRRGTWWRPACRKWFCLAGAIVLHGLCKYLEGPASLFVAGAVHRSTLDASCCVLLQSALSGLRQPAPRCKLCGRRGIWWGVERCWIYLCMEGARFGGVARVMTRSVLQRGPTKVSDESLTLVSQKRIFQECVAVLSQKGVSKSVSEECLQEMPTRVSQKGVFKECLHRSVPVWCGLRKLPSPSIPLGKVLLYYCIDVQRKI